MNYVTLSGVNVLIFVALSYSLNTINNDRIEGYETASKETEEHDLKIVFAQFISTSKKCKQELVREV